MYPRVVSHTWLWRRTRREGKPFSQGERLWRHRPRYGTFLGDTTSCAAAPEAHQGMDLVKGFHYAVARASLRGSGFTRRLRSVLRTPAPPLCSVLVYRRLIHSITSRRMPFAFLDDLQRRFEAFSPSSSSSPGFAPSAHSYSGFQPQLASLLRQYNDNPPPDALRSAQQNLAQVKDIMVQNVEQILSRGERIELLVDKTDTMAGQAWAFRRGARQVRRQQFWRNQKIMILSIAVGIVSPPLYAYLRPSLMFGLPSCSSTSLLPNFADLVYTAFRRSNDIKGGGVWGQGSLCILSYSSQFSKFFRPRW